MTTGADADRRVLVVGEALVDIRLDEREGADATAQEHPGGSPLNIAVGLSRMGVATALAAQVGDDARGDDIARHVAASGVELLRQEPQHTTSTAAARIRPDGAATYHFELEWNPAELPDPSGFAWVHVGSIGSALAPGADLVAELVAAAAAAGVPVSFDPNVRPDITPDIGDVRRRTSALIDGATVVKLSDEDAEELFPGVELEQVARNLVQQPRVRLAVITRGAQGLMLHSPAASVTVQTPPMDVVDTIGAGDTVMAALITGLLIEDGLDAGHRLDAEHLRRLGEFATGAAAITCSRPGADPPWHDELPQLNRGAATAQ